jgi:predicted dithiol-disulfide oxidoreductase (DUF899 family)
MNVTFPGESAEYRAARELLLEREMELRRAMEDVARARRELPPGGEIPEDYVFQGVRADGSEGDVRMSELFAPGKDSLLIYSAMFPRDPADDRPGPHSGRSAALALEDGPCPSCVGFIDSLDGAAEHFSERSRLVIVAKTTLPRLLALGEDRGWRHLPLLSSAQNSYNRDYLAEDEEGRQLPMLNVFQRDGRTIRHFWGTELFFAPTDPGEDTRHVGTIESLWNLLDLTPEGRGDFDEQLDYAAARAAGS